ncbi:MAG TPA: Na+/H+ antiporter NhaA [Thermomicrobiaceae bacterium]|nr:Na+/H+ antiporter NhaA [Thermomicrobiaceae bacterium]
METPPELEPEETAEETEEEGDSGDAAVTISVTYFVRPDREPQFQEFLSGVTQAASRFPGYVGTRTFRGLGNSNRYRVVFRFDNLRALHRWQDSEERRHWNELLPEFEASPRRAVDISGTSQELTLALALTPLQSFVRTSVSGIGLLLLGTALALVLANSPWSDAYSRFWATDLTLRVGGYGISQTLRLWVNDGLMSLFFFIVGLEIKREILVGELSSPRQAAFPIAAAIGGGAVPALVFAVLNLGGSGAHGWGIPMGTDTAFSLGVISLFAARVSPVLVVFLTASTIVDDILAVLVIAVFYTDSISWPALGAAAVLMGALILANRAGFRRWPVYAVLGVGVWLAIFASGVHGTLAGVLVAMTVPARSWVNPREFLRHGRHLLDEFERAGTTSGTVLSNEEQQQVTHALEHLTEGAESPMTHFQHQLNPWVAFAILPLFAFANAGIPLIHGLGAAFTSPVTWGVIAGLIVGKPIGITLVSWLAVKSGATVLPSPITWRQIFAVAWLGGIGFTMSLFITELAFDSDPLSDAARVGILAGSIVAGLVGYALLNSWLPAPHAEKDT